VNVVLLDDELVSLAFLRSRVSKLPGATPIGFDEPREALAWCAANEADVVIVDYLMPDMDGLAFAAAVRELPGKAEIPILMITGARKTHVRHRALAEGINGFLAKPFDRFELSARLKNLLAVRTSHKRVNQRAQA
jgi:two-component system response regulator RpfG